MHTTPDYLPNQQEFEQQFSPDMSLAEQIEAMGPNFQRKNDADMKWDKQQDNSELDHSGVLNQSIPSDRRYSKLQKASSK